MQPAQHPPFRLPNTLQKQLGRWHVLLVLAAMAWVAFGCKKMPEANAKVNIAVGGLCERCPTARLDTLLRRLQGIVEVSIDTAQSSVQLAFDSTYITPASIAMILNDAGYDADDSPAFAPGLVDACCTQPDDRRNGLSQRGKRGEKPDDNDPEPDDSLSLELEHILGATDQATIFLDELDPELDAVLEEDILNEVEMNQLDLPNPEVGDEILDEDPEVGPQ